MRWSSSNALTKLAFLTFTHVVFWHATFALPGNPVLLQSGDSSSKGKPFSTGLELRSDPEGVDFGPYLRSVFVSIRRKWTIMTAETKDPETGTVTVQFRITSDGRVSDDSVKIVLSSGKKEMDDICMKVIRTAAPFEHLPEAFHSPFIELRQTLYFNPPKSPQH
jgi:TonB family protein